MSKYSLFVALFALGSLSAGDATYFSFASDDSPTDPTFSAVPGNFFTGNGVFDLTLDVNGEDTGGMVTFEASFSFAATTYDYQTVAVGPNWLHIWRVRGDFSFTHWAWPGTPILIEVDFDDATLTARSSSRDFISGTMTLQCNSLQDPSLTFTPSALLNGVIQTALTKEEDFAFTFTRARDEVSPKVFVHPNGDWLEGWTAEGSFSASAH